MSDLTPVSVSPSSAPSARRDDMPPHQEEDEATPPHRDDDTATAAATPAPGRGCPAPLDVSNRWGDAP